MFLDGYPTLSSFVDTPKGVRTMDKIVSTIILVVASIALTLAITTYYTGLADIFMRYEEVSFDLAYTALRNGEAEIVLNFRNMGKGALTVMAIEINGADLEPTGNNPFPLEIPLRQS